MDKKIPPSRNLIASSSDELSSLIIFLNFYEKTVDYIIVKYEATNMASGKGTSISGTYINSETVESPVTHI